MSITDDQLHRHVTRLAASSEAHARWAAAHPALGVLTPSIDHLRQQLLAVRPGPHADQITRILLDLAHGGDHDAALVLLDILACIARRYPWAPNQQRYGSTDSGDQRRAELYGDLACAVATMRDHHRLDNLPVRLVSRAASAYRHRAHQPRSVAATPVEPDALIGLDRRQARGVDGQVDTRIALGQWRAAIQRQIDAGELKRTDWEALTEGRLRPALTDTAQPAEEAKRVRGRRAARRLHHLSDRYLGST